MREADDVLGIDAGVAGDDETGVVSHVDVERTKIGEWRQEMQNPRLFHLCLASLQRIASSSADAYPARLVRREHRRHAPNLAAAIATGADTEGQRGVRAEAPHKLGPERLRLAVILDKDED